MKGLEDFILDIGGEEREKYLLGEFVKGAESGFFQMFQEKRNLFGREFSGMTPYRQQEKDIFENGQKGYFEEWYGILEELGSSTQEGIFVKPSKIGEIVDTIETYSLDKYRDPA